MPSGKSTKTRRSLSDANMPQSLISFASARWKLSQINFTVGVRVYSRCNRESWIMHSTVRVIGKSKFSVNCLLKKSILWGGLDEVVAERHGCVQ